MSDIRSTIIRFNLKKPLHQKAWKYLQMMDRQMFKSYSHAVITALADYFDRLYNARDMPEPDAHDEMLISRISEEVEKRLQHMVITDVIKNDMNGDTDAETVEPSSTKKTNIDWDFIGKG